MFSVCNPHTLNAINQFYIMHFSGSSIKITTIARQLGTENPAVVPSASISTPISGSPSFQRWGERPREGKGVLRFLQHRWEKQDGNSMRLDLAPGQKTLQPLQVDPLLIHNIIQ